MTLQVPYVHEEFIHNKRAAHLVLPYLFRSWKPNSVLDVGCGLGTWLTVCEELGIQDYLGVDGDYVNLTKLTIPQSKFKTLDLRNPFDLRRRFDLVLCLEVAEHLPEAAANSLVQSLVNHGKVILFSAAIPGQGGQNHINEQWPEYWQEKFAAYGYYFHDTIRPEFWNNPSVDLWYRQNVFFVKPEKPAVKPMLSIVHPELFASHISVREEYLSSLMAGRHGIKISFSIFLNSLKVKLKYLLGKSKMD